MKKKKKSGILTFLNSTVVKLSAVIIIILGIYIFSVLQKGPLDNVSEQKVISRQINIPTRQHAKSRKIQLDDTSASLTKKEDSKPDPLTESDIKQPEEENKEKDLADTTQPTPDTPSQPETSPSIDLAAVDKLENKTPEHFPQKNDSTRDELEDSNTKESSEKMSDSASQEEQAQVVTPPPVIEKEPQPIAPAQPLSLYEITRITPRHENSNFIIEIETNNRLETVKYYRYKSPPRLVVDLHGEWKKPKSYKVRINQNIVKQIRLWNYPQKLRLTHDLTQEPTVKPVVKKTSTGMKIIFSDTTGH